MKNIVVALFSLIVCFAGALIAAAIYFSLAFGALGWLIGAGPARLGEAIGAATGALGFPVGAVLFGLLFWDRLRRADGSPDRLASALAATLATPLALAPLLLLGPAALSAASQFKAPGFLALAGFLGLVGWVEESLRDKT